jgi:hypothetical protein
MAVSVSGSIHAQGARTDTALTQRLLQEAHEGCFAALRAREQLVRNQAGARLIESSEDRVVSERPDGSRQTYTCRIRVDGQIVESSTRDVVQFGAEETFRRFAQNYCEAVLSGVIEEVEKSPTSRIIRMSPNNLVMLRRVFSLDNIVRVREELTCSGQREGEMGVVSVVHRTGPTSSGAPR